MDAYAKIFDSIGDLPANVRDRLSVADQRIWLRVFNDVFERTDGSESDKEAAAFRAANGAVKKMRRTGKTFERLVPITKIELEKQIVWGWAYVSEENGAQVIDHGGDVAESEVVEKAAHGFVRDSRVGGVLHQDEAGEIVDSLFFSKAVQEALGIDLHKVGWFIGFHVTDPEAWAGVKDGTYQAFSIGGDAAVEEI